MTSQSYCHSKKHFQWWRIRQRMCPGSLSQLHPWHKWTSVLVLQQCEYCYTQPSEATNPTEHRRVHCTLATTQQRAPNSRQQKGRKHPRAAIRTLNFEGKIWWVLFCFFFLFHPFSQSCLVNGNAYSLTVPREKGLEQGLCTSSSWFSIRIH